LAWRRLLQRAQAVLLAGRVVSEGGKARALLAQPVQALLHRLRPPQRGQLLRLQPQVCLGQSPWSPAKTRGDESA